MLNEKFVEAIEKLSISAQESEVVFTDSDGRTLWIAVNGEVRPYSVSPPNRNHVVRSLADLLQYAEDHSDADPPVMPQPEIYHYESGVTLLLDANDRRDTVHFPLTFSAQFARLQQLAKALTPMDQRAFVRLLQFEFGLERAHVAVWRKLDWQTQAAVSGEVTPGKDRLGKEIRSQVAGTAELPEDIVIRCPVYREAGERELYSIRCAIELDTARQAIALVPLPNELETVIDARQSSIHQRILDAVEVPTYYGRP